MNRKTQILPFSYFSIPLIFYHWVFSLRFVLGGRSESKAKITLCGLCVLLNFLSMVNCSHEFEYGYYHDDGACFSPDGNYTAFAHAQVYYQESGAVDTLVSGIYIMKLDGIELQLVCEGLGNTVDWSPDGKMLVFNAYNELWLYIIEQDSLLQLTNDGEIKHSARFSPDSEKIAYFRVFVPGGICVMNVDGTDDHSVINDTVGYPACGPDWFTSGDKFLFVGWFGDKTILCSIDTTEENLTTILTAEDMGFVAPTFTYPRLSPDEKEILFYARKEGKEKNYEIWKVDINGTEPKQLTYSGGADPCWSRDGEWILFSDGSNGGLSLMRSDGSDRQSIISYD